MLKKDLDFMYKHIIVKPWLTSESFHNKEECYEDVFQGFGNRIGHGRGVVVTHVLQTVKLAQG